MIHLFFFVVSRQDCLAPYWPFILRALTRSSPGLDLDVWLNYRTHALDAPSRSPGGSLTASLG